MVGCSVHNVSNFNTLYKDNNDFNHFNQVVFELLLADGLLSALISFVIFKKYSSVKVLNFSINTRELSNNNWIYFYSLTAISSILSSLDFLITTNKRVLFSLSWISYIFAVCALAFAIKDQWRYKNKAFNRLEEQTERNPLLINSHHNTIEPHSLILTVILLTSTTLCSILIIIAIYPDYDSLYWSAFGILWFIRVVTIYIAIMAAVFHKCHRNNPSKITKALLLIGVLLNMVMDIPPYIWIECISDHPYYYYAIISAFIASHVVFFAVLHAEFIRLKEVTQWNAACRIDKFEESGVHTQS